MTAVYDEIEIEDFEYDADLSSYFYPCPCGDRFQITLEELLEGEEIARCPSCSLMIRVICDEDSIRKSRESLEAAGAMQPVAA